jgi:hypothetical protein
MKVNVRGHGGGAVLEICGYENPAATTKDDANWLNCLIDLELHGFSAHASVNLTTHDLVAFQNELSQATLPNGGRATLADYEGTIELSITISPSGGGSINGFVARKGGLRAKLEFVIPCDQSFMASTLADISKAKATFPEKN